MHDHVSVALIALYKPVAKNECNSVDTNHCPSCRHGDVINLGPIPSADRFAGRTLPRMLPGGTLYRCQACGLGYRYPRLAKKELDELYRYGEPSVWNFEPHERTDWRLAKEILERRFPGDADVLDVGCFDGGFLTGLTTSRRYGIEINPAGAARARERGIAILSEDYKWIAATNLDFDVVTAFDVIEHVDDPRSFFISLSRHIKAGGLMVISTGNFDAWTRRIAGGRYWYCAIPEHISFLSRDWFQSISAELGLKVAEMVTFSHENASLPVRLGEAAANALYLIAPGAIRYLRAKGLGKSKASSAPQNCDSPPRWLSARDHILAVFEKPAATDHR
jgi:SAM-dependent methyltransferase